MQKVGVSIRLAARDVADIERYCEQNHIKPSEWFRIVIENELHNLKAKAEKPADTITQ